MGDTKTVKEIVKTDKGFIVVEEKPRDPAILAVLGAMAVAGFAEHVIGMLVENVMRPADSGAELLSKGGTYQLYKGQAIGAAIDAIRTAFFPQPRTDNAGYNIDYQQFEQIMDKLMWATIVMGTLISEDASEITMELLQESLSNSLQYSLGGMWALMSAYSVGFGMPQQLLLMGEEDIHPYSIASLDAWTGQLKHGLVAQHYLRVKQRWERVHQHEIERWLAKGHEFLQLPELTIAARMLAKVPDSIDRMADVMVEIVSVMLRRVHDLALALEAAYRDYQAGILSDYEFNTLAASISNSVDAIDRELDSIIEDAMNLSQHLNLIVDIGGVPTDIMAELDTAIQQTVFSLYDNVYNPFNNELVKSIADYITAMNTIRKLTHSTVEYTVKFDGVIKTCVSTPNQPCP